MESKIIYSEPEEYFTKEMLDVLNGETSENSDSNSKDDTNKDEKEFGK
jgi:hypothetical protein